MSTILNPINCCNDYSLSSANTGIAIVKVANPYLDGSGTLVQVLKGAENGTTVKSIIIKAAQANTTGMIRLFIANSDRSIISLYREIPVPVNPSLSSTPTPPPVLPMLEIDLLTDFKLQNGALLLASTQNGEQFNIIGEGVDWQYPHTLPPSCSNYVQTTALVGVGTIDEANTKLDGSGTIVPIFTVPSGNGAVIKTITIAALQSTYVGMVRLFISTGGDDPSYVLMMEINIPQSNQSPYIPSFKVELKEDFHLQSGYIIGASTQISNSFAITIDALQWSYPIS